MSDDIEETQWTAASRQAYIARGDELLEALREHIAVTAARLGSQSEFEQYFPSASRLRAAAVALDGAEFDWCGSFPLRLNAEDDDDDDDDDDAVGGATLTVVGRWDYRVVDEATVIDAGREAYKGLWDENDDDASRAVFDVSSAAREIAHADGWDALTSTAGLQPLASTQSVIVHDCVDPWYESDGDPYAIVQD